LSCPPLRQGQSFRTAAATNLPNHAASRKKLRRRSRNKAGVYSFNETTNRWAADLIYKHHPTAILIFCLM